MRMTLSAATFAMLLGASVLAIPAEAAKSADPSLYTRLGGKPAIRAVVEDFVGNVANDGRINKFFAKTNLPHLRYLLTEQICQGTGGPCRYKGRNMKEAHKTLGIAGMDFGALVEDLQQSLKKFGVPAREQGELLAILGPMKRDIVTR